MSKKKQTFVDPKTGQEMEITPLGQWAARLSTGLIAALFGGLVVGLAWGLVKPGFKGDSFPFLFAGWAFVGSVFLLYGRMTMALARVISKLIQEEISYR